MKFLYETQSLILLPYCSPAQGHGAKGDNEYKFSLEFLEPVRPEVLLFLFISY